MKKLFIIITVFLSMVSYAKAEEQVPLPLCNDSELAEKLSSKIKEAYKVKYADDDLYSKRQRKLFLKNVRDLEEVNVSEINKSNFDFYSKYTELKINKALTAEDIRVCKLKKNNNLKKVYLLIYKYKGETFVDFVNFKITSYKKLNNMKL